MTQTPSPAEPREVFVSYAHEDERMRAELVKHLSNLERQKLISAWHDRAIGAGDEWAREIDRHLDSAGIILLLISPDFMASDYCNDIEVTRAMERHEAGEATVIPVILRPVDWSGAPFSKLQAFPKDAKPVTDWRNRDEAYLNVVNGIRAAINNRGRPISSDAGERAAPAPAPVAVPDSSDSPLQFVSIKIGAENPFWIDGRTNRFDGDYVYPSRIFDWQWRHVFDLVVTARPEVDPALDVTLKNRGRGPLLVTEIGLEVLSVGHIGYSGASMPKAVPVPLTAKYVIRMPDLGRLTPDGFSDFRAEVHKTAWAGIPDPIEVGGQAPFRFELLLQEFGRRTPRFALLRLFAETDSGTAYSENIVFRRWM